MRRVMVGLVLAMAIGAAVPVAAQSPGLDAPTLLAACQAGAGDDVELATCEWVVSTVLAPDPAASPAAYGEGLPGPGVTLARDDETVTLVEVDWNASKKLDRKPDDKANRYIAIRVLYEATEDGASYNPFHWSVVDLDGFAWEQTFIGRDPVLQSSNDLPAGRKAQGWVTFEVPKAVRTFEVVESQDGYLRWLINEPE